VLERQELAEDIRVDETVRRYIVDLARVDAPSATANGESSVEAGADQLDSDAVGDEDQRDDGDPSGHADRIATDRDEQS